MTEAPHKQPLSNEEKLWGASGVSGIKDVIVHTAELTAGTFYQHGDTF